MREGIKGYRDRGIKCRVRLTLSLCSFISLPLFLVKAEGIGHVEAPSLNESDEGWTNDAWGKSGVSISVYVSGIGEVEIETVARQTI